MNIIEFKDVSKFFFTQKLYDNVNFTIGTKEKIALLGNNGVGKSTLVKLIMDEEIPDGVSVKLFNISASTFTRAGAKLDAGYLLSTTEFI
jgi:ABC-type multidrug transport system ATPase subunit